MTKNKSVLTVTALCAALASPLAHAGATAKVSIYALPITVIDLGTSNPYYPSTPRFSYATQGADYFVDNGRSGFGVMGLLNSGPVTNTASTGDSYMSWTSNGADRVDLTASIGEMGAALVNFAITSHYRIMPRTTVTFTTHSDISVTYEGDFSGKAYAFTSPSLSRIDGTFDDSRPRSFEAYGNGSWQDDEVSTFTNSTDYEMSISYIYHAYVNLSAPQPLPPVVEVPEPATYAMFAAGVLVLVGARQRKKA